MGERHDGLSRRDFLRLGLLAGSAAAAGCAWDGGALLRPKLAAISRVNDWVGEHIFLSNDRLARQWPASARSHSMPNYHIAESTPVLDDPAAWALSVGGLVRKPMRLTLPMLQALPRVTYTVPHHCVEGWTTIATWTGVPVRAVAARVLERSGFAVIQAGSGEEALDICARPGSRLRGVVLDLTMPGLGGEATYRQIRAEWPDLPVIVSSGYMPQEGELGDVPFLAKPYRPSELLDMLRGMLEPIPPSSATV